MLENSGCGHFGLRTFSTRGAERGLSRRDTACEAVSKACARPGAAHQASMSGPSEGTQLNAAWDETAAADGGDATTKPKRASAVPSVARVFEEDEATAAASMKSKFCIFQLFELEYRTL